SLRVTLAPACSRSSVGSSVGLRTRRPQVQVLPGAPLVLHPSSRTHTTRSTVYERNTWPSIGGAGSPRSRLALFHPRLLRTRYSAPEMELLILVRDLEVVWEGVRMENDVILEV